jgi:penicillin-binding protein 1A
MRRVWRSRNGTSRRTQASQVVAGTTGPVTAGRGAIETEAPTTPRGGWRSRLRSTRVARAWRALVAYGRAHPRVVAFTAVATLGGIALVAGLLLGTWENVCHDCPSIAQIYVWQPKQSTKILDRNGQVVAELFQERRTPVSLSELPAYVPAAFVAVEDKRFYHHHGFDLYRTVGAAVQNLLHGYGAAGGSTITQQLARNMFTKQVGFQTSLVRKLKELHVALELEQVYTKQEILEAYLNQINFGHGWYGLETASQHYFGKPARELTQPEAAMLVALAKAPGRYDPLTHPERARGRRNLVLSVMADQGVISQADAEKWKQAPIPTQAQGVDEGTFAPYFVEWVRQALDDRFGSDVYQEGYRVYTTLDANLQRYANDAMQWGWKRIEGQRGYHWPTYDSLHVAGPLKESDTSPYVQGAFIAMDPASGDVLAMIGGRNFNESKFNRATQALRQPGSAFKPFVYSAAIASGIPASHVIEDSPVELQLDNGQVYSPRNYEHDFQGPVTLREALMHSINTVAVKLAMQVGLETVAQYAQRMGIQTPIPRYPSIAIGSPDVIPLQLAGAYTTFATMGVHAEPRAILRVEDADGHVLWQTHTENRQVLDSAQAYIVTDMLRDALDHGTGYPARDPSLGNLPYTVPAAGKTGTTNDATDVWFIGFTPNLLAAVWFGFDQPKKIIAGAAGGVYAAPVWGRFMRQVYVSGDSTWAVPQPWPMPPEITTRQVDDETGQLATAWCPPDHVYTEIYLPGTEPTQACELHGPHGILGTPLLGKPVLPAADTSGG